MNIYYVPIFLLFRTTGSPDIWFDGVDDILLEPPRPVAVEIVESRGVKRNPLVKSNSSEG